MKKLNLLSRAEMRNVMGGGCPAWYQAECLEETLSIEPSGNPAMDEYLYNMIFEICMTRYADRPDRDTP